MAGRSGGRGPATHKIDRIVLLGPQAQAPTVLPTLDSLGIDGHVGLITAGWREFESDMTSVDPSLAARARLLPLYDQADRAWQEDPELADGHRSLQLAVRTVRAAYNVRLAHAMDAIATIRTLDGDPTARDQEAEAAFQAVRALDDRQIERVAELRAEYDERFTPSLRPAVRRARDELAELLAPLDTVVVEGGHVAVLLNRMRLFGLVPLLAGKTVVACSGAAMVFAERLVLFHDSPPQGPGHAEVAEAGLGLYPALVPLPHAAQRLRLDDAARVARMAKRLAPAECVVLDPETRIIWAEGIWRYQHARSLSTGGTVEAREVAA